MKTNRKIAIPIIILSVIIIILAMCQLFGVWKNAIYVYEPLTGIVLILQAILLWNTNRKIAILQLVAAVFILLAAVCILILK